MIVWITTAYSSYLSVYTFSMYISCCIGDPVLLPTLIECIRFRGQKRRINIPQEIGTKYKTFGILLLEDSNGVRVDALELEHRFNSELINSKILQEWIAGKGKHPVTWKTLTEVLRDVELRTLAEDIDSVKCCSDSEML